MKRIIFRFWLINIFISIALFVTYRIVIAETNHVDGNFLEWVLQILDIILNLAYSFIYLIAMAFCSFALFLNLIEKIRSNFYLSLLTFLGIPSFCVIVILIDIQLKNLILFSIIYLFLMTIEFILFRKRINKLRPK
ncbi:hypothetical protein B0A77_13620 [Flavobacterium branchiophilum]|uniref:Uncharacterized protein n=1 Tax=Flavobacterium branchiophilum TaxID=55197 RepID=A0A2H3K8W1_9FLAO|nr:hypothetical protein B0A77_13620 [Flavobacterium branchiophilum]